jgi:hypothetical protein
MNNRHHIEIDRLRVVRQAAMESAYTAVKRADANELCDTVPIVEADDEMITVIWMKSCAQLLTFLRTHLRRNDGFVLSAQYDENAFRALLTYCSETPCMALDTAMATYLAKDILAEWMSMALPEREPACRAAAEQVLLTIEQYIATLRRPLRVRKRMEIV